MIADQRRLVAAQNRGSTHAIDVVERAEWLLPQRVAIYVVGQQPEIRQKDKDAFAIAGRTGGSRGVALVVDLLARPGRQAPPELLAGRPVQRHRKQLVAFEGGVEYAAAD